MNKLPNFMAAKEPMICGTLPAKGQARRRFVLGASSLLALGATPFANQLLASTAAARTGPETLTGQTFNLNIGHQRVNFTGRERLATTVNGSLPAPILRWREGERVTLRVTNTLDVDSSIHWHGLILPWHMDGVPGISFDGIKPGETFEYTFDLVQSGTYWYHSHSAFQEQTGLIGAIVIDPKEPDPIAFDRDLVVLLSDWSDEKPANVYAKLKKMSHYYNRRERTLGDLWRDVQDNGVAATTSDRAMWNQMRMSNTDIADVTGYTYTYLMNGVTPDEGWLGEFRPGEKVRLRFINAAAMSIFDLRIPGLKMTVVAADGQNIQPVEVDEFRIAVAETYDVIVEPEGDRAYTIFAQSNDRSGYARGTLTPDVTLRAAVPDMDPAPVLGHAEMGMAMAGMDHSTHVEQSPAEQAPTDHSSHGVVPTPEVDHSSHGAAATPEIDHSDHAAPSPAGQAPTDHSAHTGASLAGQAPTDQVSTDHSNHRMLSPAGFGSNFGTAPAVTHGANEFGPHVDYRSAAPQSGLADPGIGLRDHHKLYNRRVLTYADIRGLTPTQDKRQPTREIELHLTGNMRRYMWSLNGVSFHHESPLLLQYGERVRIILVNDTMMTHPIHLHGMWSELETGDPDYLPRKHTIIVQPGALVSYLVTADAPGPWAFHCHLMYHMPGMMREVRVSQEMPT